MGLIAAIVLIVASVSASTATAHVSGDRQGTSCQAYVLGGCTTGPHRMDASNITLGLQWNTALDAVVENRIQWTGEDLVLRCHLDGFSRSCVVEGDVPPPGTWTLHTCRTVEQETAASWVCTLGHGAPGSLHATSDAPSMGLGASQSLSRLVGPS